MKIANIDKNILANGLALSLLGDLVSGMIFCTGYIVIEYFYESIDDRSQSEISQLNPRDRSKLASQNKGSIARANAYANEAKLITINRE